MNDKITPESLIGGNRKVDKVEFNDHVPQIDKINQAMNQQQQPVQQQPVQQQQQQPQQQQQQPQQPAQQPVQNAYSQPPQQTQPNVARDNAVKTASRNTPAPRQVDDRAKAKHPVFQKLKKSFGLNKDVHHKLEIFTEEGNKLEFTMTAYGEDLTSWAYVDSQQRAENQDQSFLVGWYELLQGCLSVIAMDGVPIYEVLSIRPTDDESSYVANDPFNIPSSLRKKCAVELASEIWEDTALIGNKIYSFYEDKVVDINRFKSSLEEEYSRKERYICPIDSCNELFLAEPTFDDNGQENPYFCRIHGLHLIKGLRKGEEVNLPLE